MRIVLLLACAALAFPAAAGDVLGVVRYDGPAPTAEPLRVTKDQRACGESVPDESLVVSEGRLANAVVSVRAIPGVRPRPVTAVLEQRKCRFVPRVLAVPVGSTVEIVNSDDLLHNAHGWNGRATVFNVPTPTEGDRVPKPLRKPGLVKVGCDVHAWMAAWIQVAEGPAAVTAADGSYRLTGLPPGTYDVKVWHERLGEQTASVAVPPDGDASLDLTFTAR